MGTRSKQDVCMLPHDPADLHAAGILLDHAGWSSSHGHHTKSMSSTLSLSLAEDVYLLEKPTMDLLKLSSSLARRPGARPTNYPLSFGKNSSSLIIRGPGR